MFCRRPELVVCFLEARASGVGWQCVADPEHWASCVSTDILCRFSVSSAIHACTAAAEPTPTVCQAPSKASPFSSSSRRFYEKGTMVVPAL